MRGKPCNRLLMPNAPKRTVRTNSTKITVVVILAVVALIVAMGIYRDHRADQQRDERIGRITDSILCDQYGQCDE